MYHSNIHPSIPEFGFLSIATMPATITTRYSYMSILSSSSMQQPKSLTRTETSDPNHVFPGEITCCLHNSCHLDHRAVHCRSSFVTLPLSSCHKKYTSIDKG